MTTTTTTPSPITADIADRIKLAMSERDLSQKRLAEAIGVSESIMSRVLNGQRKLSASELGAIADCLGVTTGRLLGKQGDSQAPLAMAARLGALSADLPNEAEARNMAEILVRGRQILELRGLLNRLVESAPRDLVGPISAPTVGLFKSQGVAMAANVRTALGFDDIEPIDDLVGVIEGRFGAEVSIESLDNNIHGVLLTDAGSDDAGTTPCTVILVHGGDTVLKQRYTLAHELAHLVFEDAEVVLVDYTLAAGSNLRELRANYFAVSFLAPEAGVQRILDAAGEAPGDLEAREAWIAGVIANVALTYGLSVQSSIYHCDNLGLITAADKALAMGMSAGELMKLGGRGDEWHELDSLQNITAPPADLTAQALFAYSEGMIGIEPLAQLWKASDAEGLRTELAANGWVPQFS